MGQTDILNILKDGKRLTAAEIAELTEVTLNSVHVSIRRLLKDVSEKLETEELTQEEKIKKFGRPIGKRVKIYWLEE